MKLPSLRTLERAARIIPVVKDLLPRTNESDSGLLEIIKQQEDALHDKKADICKLREQIIELEENLENTIWMLTKAQEELNGERK